MPRYIDADAFIEDIKTEAMNLFFDGMKGTPRPRKELYDIIDRIQEQPSADVVPKSEVERLQEEADRYKRYFFRHDYDEMIAEVLDKLDRFINSNCIEIKDERGIKGYVTSGVHFAIAELKKKYTEETK